MPCLRRVQTVRELCEQFVTARRPQGSPRPGSDSRSTRAAAYMPPHTRPPPTAMRGRKIKSFISKSDSNNGRKYCRCDNASAVTHVTELGDKDTQPERRRRELGRPSASAELFYRALALLLGLSFSATDSARDAGSFGSGLGGGS